ncbi:caspase, EACC1-associated type [Streptomyces antibioticus]|uniref:caspase, EACC1-associated type n=1 Tax=Streptomyces antibioticus TaxID=1890 RepID=UPI0022561C08|nr:SAV_2336 N-terminal domain-related protein [Streptomyces antibioticus]MCX4739299.1 caspase family protein [Streptomyces antibioticus]
MFEELCRILGDAGQPMEPEDLLDVLWLADRIPSGPKAPLAGHAPRAADPPAPSTGPTPSDVPAETGSHVRTEPPAETVEPATRRTPSHLPVVSGPFATEAPGEALWTPGARALGPTLPLGRALRPLKRRVPSRRHSELDEVATADLQADTRTPQVVLRGRPERWLRLALIIDDGVSMLLWERQCAELKALLERSGAFRQVDTYQIRYGGDGDAGGGVRLGRPWSLSPETRPADSVADVSGRTMVLVVTDGAAAAWREGRLRPVLERWARCGPTAIVHTLPRRLWAGSGVRADTWQVTSPRPGAPNSAWTVRDPVLPPSVAPPPPVPVPVLDLTPGDFAAWAAVTTVVGRPVPVRLWTPQPSRPPVEEPGRVSVRDFGRAASPEAVRLAAHLAAMAPVTVPVMQLVHACLDPRQGTAPLAEVVLGGLVQPLPPSGDARFTGRHRLFDFTAEAKDLLLDAVPTAELLACSRLVGERIESLLGRSSDFAAWPLSGEGAATPFAYLGPALQARLGVAGDAVTETVDVRRLSGDVLAESLRLMCDALSWHSPGWADESDLPPLRLAGYLDGTVLPDWGFVTTLVDLVTRFEPALFGDLWDRLRAQYVEAMLPGCDTEVRLAFDRSRIGLHHADLLLLHLLLYMHTKSGAAEMAEAEIAEDLTAFLGARGLRLQRESLRVRHDLIWDFGGGHCIVEIRRTRLPFDWTGVMHFARSLGTSAAAVGFFVAVDDSVLSDGPVRLEECVVTDAEPTVGGPVVGLRFQNGPQPASVAARVCVVVDVVGQHVSREALWEVLDHAVRAAGVSRDACLRQDRGDGALVLLPQGVDESRAVPGFIDGLAQGLRGRSMRLRVAMDRGVVEVRQFGVIGDVVIRASRLADSAHLRETRSAYGLLVSDPLYEDVHALRGRFRRVRVDFTDYRAWAWLEDGDHSPRLPDPSRSNAVLVGASAYAELPDLPAVDRGLRDLMYLLTDPESGAFSSGRTTVMANPSSRDALLVAVHRAAQAAEDTLLVYFAGHSLYDSVSGELSLAVRDTRPNSPYTALPFDAIRRELNHSAARHKIVILDCCYSGAAGSTSLPGVFNIRPDSDEVTVLAASDRTAIAAPGDRYTAFTGALVDVLANGLDEGPDTIDTELLYQEARRRLGPLPQPILASNRQVDRTVALARNRAR